jgi:hypothetical protein
LSIKELLAEGGGLLVILLTLIQIAPVKINPWSYLAKKIGRALNTDTLDRVAKVEAQLNDVSKQLSTMREEEAERNAVDCKTRILRFGDEILHGMEHSKEHFTQILRDITQYEQYCEDHPKFPNNNTVITSQVIKDTYRKRWDEHDFL